MIGGRWFVSFWSSLQSWLLFMPLHGLHVQIQGASLHYVRWIFSLWCVKFIIKVHYWLSLSVPWSRLFSVSVVSLVFCKTSLTSSRYHLIPISFLPYGPWVWKVMVWFQCQILGLAWVQPPSLELPYLAFTLLNSSRALGLCSCQVPRASKVCLTVLQV